MEQNVRHLNCCGLLQISIVNRATGLPEMGQGFKSPKCMRGMVLVSGGPTGLEVLVDFFPFHTTKGKGLCVISPLPFWKLLNEKNKFSWKS